MKHSLVHLLVFVIIVSFFSCQKERSFENSTTPALGSLMSDVTGECLPKTVVGSYVAGSALTGGNYIELSLDVSAAGSYTISTDTTNGFSFKGAGTFPDTGSNTVRLQGVGTPTSVGTNLFIITFDTTYCLIQVATLSAGTGGPATFTLQSSGGNCSGAVINGSYGIGVALNATHKIDISVNVTAIGTYNISTTAKNGMTFSASGAFTGTGVQTVTLVGSGSPTTAGDNTIALTAGSSSCNFIVNVGSPASGTLGGAPGTCTSTTVDGTYTQGVTLTTFNTVDIDITVATAGVYSITTNTVSGFSFSASGTFAATGSQTITLNGTGTPTASGTQTFTITFGGSSCTFDVDVVAAATIDWKFTEGAVTYQGSMDNAQFTAAGPFTIFGFSGSSVTDMITFGITDLAGGIQNNETYNSSSTTNNSAGFGFIGASEVYTADNSSTGVNVLFKVTSHNTGTKTITGTFSGTVKNASNATRTITNGEFTAIYP